MSLNFAIKMGDEVSPAAKAASSSLAKLDSAIKQENATLKALENQMRAVQKGGVVDIETHKKLAGAIQAQRDKVAGLTNDMVKSGGAGFVPAKANASALESILAKLTGQSGAAGEAMAGLGAEGGVAAAGLGAVAVGAVAVMGALGAVAVAVGFLESKLISLGVAASEAKGDVTRSLELLYGGEKAAEHTYAVLESLTGDIAISQGRVMELADTLIKAGEVNGDAMVRSIAAIGKAEAARAGAGKVLEGVITRANTSRMFGISRAELMQVGISYRDLAKEISKGTGMAVGEAELRLRTGGLRMREGLDALTKVVDAKMGDLANKKFMTVSVQSQRLHDSFMRLFEGVNGGPLATILQTMANTLDNMKASGVGDFISLAFKEISAAAEAAKPYVELFFWSAVYMAVKLYNALYPVRKAIKEAFGDQGNLEGFTNTILSIVEKIAYLVNATAKVMAWLIEAAKTETEHVEKVSSGKRYLTAGAGGQMTWVDVPEEKTVASGEKAAAGVAAGIKAGTPKVTEAMAAMGAEGVKAFDAKMQIHSPSKVMQFRGRMLDEGVAQGVNDNASEPAKAMARTGSRIAASIGSGSGGESSGGGGVVVQVYFQDGAIRGMSDVEGIKSQLTELMADVFQKAALLQGVG